MSNKTYTNPWAGLSSYQDPESADVQLKFCGRDNESFDVAQLIDDNIFVTLYGKSGTGKTSLLNAGVFPRLRQEQYLPVSIRLGMDAYNISFQQCILTKIAQALQGKGTQTTINVVPMPDDEQATEYLWSYFARTRFIATDGSTLFPVLVFDQFEEVFRNRRAEAETLLRQIHFMMDENHALSDRIINGNPYQYDFNFRFVASIREDDLYRLEDSIDNCYLPELKRCRYRLRSLSEQGARDVILIPGEGLFKAEEQKDIVEKIISKSRNEDGSISTNIISLLCSRIFTYHSSLSISEAFISPTLVDSFLKGNPFEQFYNEATRGFSNREKSYIEEHLVDSTGRRNSIPESDFLLHVKNGTVLLDGERKILQRTSTSSDGGNYRVELIHDSFCEPLEGQRQKRQQRRRIRFFVGGLMASLCVIAVIWLYLHNIQSANRQMKDNMIRFLSEKVKTITDEGDSYTAQRLALELLPMNIEKSGGDYLPEAETALRYACAHNSMVIKGHSLPVYSTTFSPNGKYVLSADSIICLWFLDNGKCSKTYKGHSDYVNSLSFSPDGKSFVSSSWDKSIKVWDIHSGKCLKTIKDSLYVWDVTYSPDGKLLFYSKQDGTYIHDAKNGSFIKKYDGHFLVGISSNSKCIFTYKDKSLFKIDINTNKQTIMIKKIGDKKSSAYNSVNGILVTYQEDGYFSVWDVSTGKNLLKFTPSFIIDEYPKFSISPNSDMIAITSIDGLVRILDCKNGNILKTFTGHTSASNIAVFSHDGKKLVSGSDDCTVRIWDLPIDNSENKLKVPEGIQDAYFSHDGQKLLIPQQDSSICVYNISTKSLMYKLKDTTWVVNASFSPDDKLIASATLDKSVRIWSIKSQKCIRKLNGHTQSVFNVTFSPDGSQIASSSADSTIRIWNSKTGKLIKILKGINRKVYGAFYSPDGKHLYSMARDSLIKIWDVSDGKCIKTINLGYHYNQAKLSKDGKYLIITCKDHIALWDIKNEKNRLTYKAHTGEVNDFTYYPNSNNIISVSSDGMVKTWDYESGICVNNEVIDKFLYVKFSPDGRLLTFIPYSRDYVLFKVFPPLQQLIDETRERFKDRPLTKEERRKYYLD